MEALSKLKGLAHQSLMDMVDELKTNLKYHALVDPGLAIGSAAPEKILITNTTTYLHNGVFKSKGTAETAFTATTHDIPCHATLVQEACYLVCLNATGTVTIHMGEIATGSGNALLPEIPAGLTPLGYLRLAVAAGTTPTDDFTAATDSLAETWLTDTYVSLGFLSPRFDAAQ